MNQPDPPLDSNPYLPPHVAGPSVVSYALPPLHWVRIVGLFLVLFLIGLPTYGLAMPFAFAVLFGGLRTDWIYRNCAKAGRVPPSYIGSSILSPILCFVFQIASAGTFVGVCAALYRDTTPPPDAVVLTVTSICSLIVLVVLYVLSVKIAVASRPPIPPSG